MFSKVVVFKFNLDFKHTFLVNSSYVFRLTYCDKTYDVQYYYQFSKN